jgi:alpha-L-rhamnosidase
VDGRRAGLLPTAAFNMDVAGFFTKWLGDVAADQYATAASRT